MQPGSVGQRVITVSAGRNLTLRNLTVTGGQAADTGGGGVYLAGGSLTLYGVHVTNNSAGYGGGIFQEGSGGRLEAVDSLIEGNTAANHGGGFYVRGNSKLTNTQVSSNSAGLHGGGLHVDSGSTEITGGTFSGNHANGGNGGGVNVNNGLTIAGTQFSGNTAGASGGALTQWNKGNTVTISKASFQNNSSKSQGGAALVNGSLTLTESTFNGNTADSGNAGNTYGGGVHTTSPATVTGSTFTGNQAKCTGCSFINGSGLSIELASGDLSLTTVTDCTFDGNTGWFGGGLNASYGTLNIRRSTFINNNAGYGAGLEAYVLNGDHLLFQNNKAINNGSGSGILVYGGASLTLKNAILANYATGIEANSGTVTEDNNLFYDNGSNGSTANGGTITPDGHSLSGLDPRLANPGGGDNHLTAQSPAISAGTDLGITTDLDDRPRLDGRFDIGAYQFWTLPTVSTDSATNITTNSASLNGTVNANDGSTTVTFQYGLTTSYGAQVTADQSPATGNSNTPVSKAIAGLTPNTTYHYRVVGVNSAGTTNGNDLTFTTQFQSNSYYLYLPMILK